jgi:hypothetical protein
VFVGSRGEDDDPQTHYYNFQNGKLVHLMSVKPPKTDDEVSDEPAAAQKSGCAAQDIQLRGFRLGMSLDEVKRRFPKKKDWMETADEVGCADQTIFGTQFNENEFRDVTLIYARFFQSRLVGISLRYKTDAKWSSIHDFAKRVSDSLGLPDAWQDPKNADAKSSQILRCGDVRLVASLAEENDKGAFLFGDAFLTLVDENAERRIKQIQSDKEEAKRKLFKP